MDNIVLAQQDNSSGEYEGYLSPPEELNTSRPIGYKLRFTFSDQKAPLFPQHQDKQFMGRAKSIHTKLINKLMENNYVHNNRLTSGFETLNKLKETTYAHIHIHFYSKAVKESIRRTIKRFLQEYDQETTGNKAMSFVAEHITDDEKFFRYPLKQGLVIRNQRGFTQEALEKMYEVAKDSYAITCQVHQKKADNKDNTDTLFLRVFNKLDKDIDNKRSICSKFLQLYISEDRPINKQTITGYVLNAQVKLGHISIDQICEDWGF